MKERKMLVVITIFQALQLTTALFFHGPSSIPVKPYNARDFSDFGFSMAYSSEMATLYVSAPKTDQMGKFYYCDMNETRFQIDCDENIMDTDPSDYNTDLFPNQHFYMGSSLAATSKYIFTCAPLWTQKADETTSDAFGTCFYNNHTDTCRYEGLFEWYQKHPSKLMDFTKFSGGTGWSTLVDEQNDLLLIIKTSLNGDILYVPASDPTMKTKSLSSSHRTNELFLLKYYNIGFGVTVGKFFSNTTTVYAFSMTEKRMEGVISFLKYNKPRHLLSLVAVKGKKVMIQNMAVDAMFGMVMSAADLNMDGLDELLVGAPTQSEEECCECGALHIYIGGDKSTINDKKRLRIILGNTELGRFGTAITSKDLDGDSKPELVVSAPYEDDGFGALYIMSGYEVYTLIKYEGHKSIPLSDLKLTQRIQKKPFKALGFSLQFVQDTNLNGCNDLAAGAPNDGQGIVLLFNCVQVINVTVTSKLLGEEMVREQDNEFHVRVCAEVQLPDLPLHIIGNITVMNSIIGQGTNIPNPKFVIDMSCFDCERFRVLCENVTVGLNDTEPGDYNFKSKAEVQNNYLSSNNRKEFNSTWVTASVHSTMEYTLPVVRHCKGNDCQPNLSMKLLWFGSERYVLGSSDNETATLLVRNDGNASYEACVWVTVSGAPPPNFSVGCKKINERYLCDLVRPLRRDTEYLINITLDMTKPSNRYQELIVDAYLSEYCDRTGIKNNSKISIPYDIMYPGGIYINKRHEHSLNITDQQVSDLNATINDYHEYIIKNNGTISWTGVKAILSVQKEPYISSFKLSKMDFGECDEAQILDTRIVYNCTLRLMPNTSYIITGTTEIIESKLQPYLFEGKTNATIYSRFELTPNWPGLPSQSVETTTRMTILKEKTLSRNKLLISLIALFVALIILAVLIFVLYKIGFFRRKQQQQLLVLKESIRRKSVRRNTHASIADAPVEGLQMDVDEDPFDDIQPVTTKDNVDLVADEKC